MTDKTAKKLPEQDKKTGRFLTGNIGGGRPQGARAKLGEAFLSDVLSDWEENGKQVIQTVRTDKPDQYLKVVASILPKDLNVNVSSVDELTDAELIERAHALHEQLSPFFDAAGVSAGSSGGGKKAGTSTKH